MYGKYINDNYIVAVGTVAGTGSEITEDEYNKILDKINNRPTAPEGFTYRLTTALKWELCKLPPVVENNEEFEDEVII